MNKKIIIWIIAVIAIVLVIAGGTILYKNNKTKSRIKG